MVDTRIRYRGFNVLGQEMGSSGLREEGAMPFDLLRSRPVAECRRALSAFLGLMLLSPLAYLVGVSMHLALLQAFA